MSHNLEVLLVATSPNVAQVSQSRFLLFETTEGLSLPTREVEAEDTTLLCAAKLLKDLTGLDAKLGGTGWVNLVPFPLADSTLRIRDGKRYIGVPYGCMMPMACLAKTSANWFTWDNILGRGDKGMVGDHFDILTLVCKNI